MRLPKTYPEVEEGVEKGEPALLYNWLIMTERESRQERWFQSALEQELTAIENLLPDLNIRKPNNLFWQSIFRIAGLSKAGFISSDAALDKIKYACRHMQLSGKEIDYQWGRAYQRALARYLKE